MHDTKHTPAVADAGTVACVVAHGEKREFETCTAPSASGIGWGRAGE